MNFLRCLLLMLVCITSYAQQSETRVALVIGNSTYRAAPLKNPTNDSRDIAAKLRGLGFTVIERSNLTVKQIGGTLREFRSKLTPGSVALVYYAGHGLQIKGENYLPAVDADISSEEDVPTQSLATKQIMDVLGDAKTRLNLVFLDACRENPYARGFRSASRGLSKESAPSGTLISFATRPGGVASDGDGRNGLYTSVLLQAMNSTNLPIEQLLKKVVSGVKLASNSQQEPWMEGSIEGDFCFGQCNALQTAVSDDRALWESVKDSKDVADLRAYLNRFPNGLFAEVAANRVRALQAAGADQGSAARAEQERRQREASEAAARKAQEERLAAERDKVSIEKKVNSIGPIEPGFCQAVRFADVGWTDITAKTAVVSEILKGIGYKPSAQVMSVPVTYRSMKDKKIDVFLGNWMPSMEGDIKPYAAEGSVETIGANLEGGSYTLAVPDYVAQAGVRTFADIAKNADKFQRKIYGIEPGNEGNELLKDIIKKNAFDLGSFKLVESSEAGMMSRVSRATSAGEWVVFLGWSPHPMNIKFKMVYLGGGDDFFGPNYGGSTVYTNTRRGYAAECPNVGTLLKNTKFTLVAESEVMFSILDKKMRPSAAAQSWLKANASTWGKWLAGVKTFDGKDVSETMVLSGLGLP